MGLKSIVILLVLISSFLAFSNAGEAESVPLADDLGRAVTIAKAPVRIISLSPSNTE